MAVDGIVELATLQVYSCSACTILQVDGVILKSENVGRTLCPTEPFFFFGGISDLTSQDLSFFSCHAQEMTPTS